MTFTPEIRKKCMQANKRKDTGPELILRRYLREYGMGGYRLQWKIKGHPDICYPGKKLAIFVNGCFWHRCPRCHPPVPQTNVQYWNEKFNRNMERDKENIETLESEGWTVLVVWECELKNNPSKVVEIIKDAYIKN